MRLAPLSKYLRDYHGRRQPYRGQIVVARVKAAVDEAALRRMVSAGMDHLTKPYDNFEILRIAMRILFRISRRTHDRKYICSELVELCYRQAGVRFHLRDNFVSPIDIWLDPYQDPSGAGYQVLQSMFAQADGGLLGEGFAESLVTIPGTETALLPPAHTDLIYTVVVSEPDSRVGLRSSPRT